jgi:hypothetical protein
MLMRNPSGDGHSNDAAYKPFAYRRNERCSCGLRRSYNTAHRRAKSTTDRRALHLCGKHVGCDGQIEISAHKIMAELDRNYSDAFSE